MSDDVSWQYAVPKASPEDLIRSYVPDSRQRGEWSDQLRAEEHLLDIIDAQRAELAVFRERQAAWLVSVDDLTAYSDRAKAAEKALAGLRAQLARVSEERDGWQVRAGGEIIASRAISAERDAALKGQAALEAVCDELSKRLAAARAEVERLTKALKSQQDENEILQADCHDGGCRACAACCDDMQARASEAEKDALDWLPKLVAAQQDNERLREALVAASKDENVPALWVENDALRQMLARVRDVLCAEIAMPHECSDCGWHVGGIPKGLHNTGCRVANAVDEARDLLDPPKPFLPGEKK